MWLPNVRNNLPFKVLNPGKLNRHGGPDFLEASIQIENVELSGAIEVHTHASEWFHHKHHLDPAYNQVVLHIVQYHDIQAMTKSGVSPLTWSMDQRFPASVVHHYCKLMEQLHPIPCRKHLPSIPTKHQHNWLEKLSEERLSSRFGEIRRWLERANFDWDWAFKLWMTAQLGTGPNKAGFHYLSEQILKYLDVLKRTDWQKDGEAILFGLAGLLEQSFTEDYPKNLKRTFAHFKTVYHLEPILPHWNYMRIRPSGYADSRIAVWSKLLPRIRFEPKQLDHWIANLSLFENWIAETLPNPYWNQHYKLGVHGFEHLPRYGKAFCHHLIINGISPFLAFWKHQSGSTSVRPVHLQWKQLKAENNRVTRTWSSFHMPPKNAMESQAMYHLLKHYCKQKRCLECQWGRLILSTPPLVT